jgi:hypothetical protein
VECGHRVRVERTRPPASRILGGRAIRWLIEWLASILYISKSNLRLMTTIEKPIDH